MKTKIITLALALALASTNALADDFENAPTAIKNMGLGWNLGNSLESNSGDTQNMWIEHWKNTVEGFETAWGQPVTTEALIKMFKEKGFNTIRIPVTWYPHMVKEWKFSGWDNSIWDKSLCDMEEYIDPAWMKRVHEVVDYCINNDMYCIVNVHHDTGASDTHWLVAEMDTYNNVKDLYEWLWTQIANEFKDYDEHVLFEGYNEMLDKYNSWCFATFNASNHYNATDAADAYDAINHYAQSFVNAVRATGGNNAERNLIVNTYGGCSGEGTWNNHLSDPLKNLTIPTDEATNHIIAEVHIYPSLGSGLSTAVKSAEQCLKSVNDNLASKGVPVLIGEWNSSDSHNDYTNSPSDYLSFVEQFEQKATTYGFGTCLWMFLSDSDDRSVPQWTHEDAADAIIKGYKAGIAAGISDVNTNLSSLTTNLYDLQGRRVENPTHGIYIKDGKKVIVK